MSDTPRTPAAFINALAEDGTKEEAIRYLQETWDERCQLERALGTMKAVATQNGDDLDECREQLTAALKAKEEAERDAQKYRWWCKHPRSYFVLVLKQDTAPTLRLEAISVEEWDKAYTEDNVDAAINEAMKK